MDSNFQAHLKGLLADLVRLKEADNPQHQKDIQRLSQAVDLLAEGKEHEARKISATLSDWGGSISVERGMLG